MGPGRINEALKIIWAHAKKKENKEKFEYYCIIKEYYRVIFSLLFLRFYDEIVSGRLILSKIADCFIIYKSPNNISIILY